MSFGCTTCSGECCRLYLVHVSGRDAVTIARGQGLAFEQFIDIVAEAEPTGAGFTLDGSGDTFALSLRRRPDGACSFLVGLTDGSQRCGIYPQRPFTCAVFPLRLYRGSDDIRPDVICEPNGRRITAVDLPHARALLVRASFEWTVYAWVVAAWNEARETVGGRLDERAYFDYVGAAYDAIDATLADRPPVETANAIEHWMDGVPAADVTADRSELERALGAALAPVAPNRVRALPTP
jgi:Fe-S-cluster containining protein